MGITVISSPSVPGTASTTPLGTATTDASTVNFATLLLGQLSNIAAPTTTTTTNISCDSKSDKASENATDDIVPSDQAATDPALAFLMATPAAPLPANKFSTPPPTPETINTSIALTSGQAQTTREANESTTPLQNTSASSIFQNLAAKPENHSGSDTPVAAANLAAEAQPLPPTGQESAPTLVASQIKAPVQTLERLEISAPLQNTNWAQSFSEKIVWLAKTDQQSAQININPPQLGPVQITLQINGDQASAVFASPHAEVRQAIENSLPQLREMLSGAGINLGQADVGANLAQQNREAPPQAMNENRSTSETAILPGDVNTNTNTSGIPLQRGRGLVDLFA